MAIYDEYRVTLRHGLKERQIWAVDLTPQMAMEAAQIEANKAIPVKKWWWQAVDAQKAPHPPRSSLPAIVGGSDEF